MLVLYGALRIAMKLLLIPAAAVNLNEFCRVLRTVQKTHTHTCYVSHLSIKKK